MGFLGALCPSKAVSLCYFCSVLMSGSVYLGAYRPPFTSVHLEACVIVALLVWVTMSAPEPMGLCGSRVLPLLCVSHLRTCGLPVPLVVSDSFF